jgi:hypothetical protein
LVHLLLLHFKELLKMEVRCSFGGIGSPVLEKRCCKGLLNLNVDATEEVP